MQRITKFNELIDRLRSIPGRKRVVVVCPGDSHTEYVIKRALEEQVADFVLIDGGICRWNVGEVCRKYPGRVEVHPAESAEMAAKVAVDLINEGKADVLMKGCVNTDKLLHAVLDKKHGLLRQGSIMSHVTVVQAPEYNKLLFATDVAVIPQPTTEQFDAMVRYAIAVCRAFGITVPRVALLHCTEKVSEKFPHTLSYVELKKRAQNGAYGDVFMDGPMDVKTACSVDSGMIKGIDSPVTGAADVLVFPNIEAGNTFYKTVSLFGRAQMAGMLCGTTAPVVLASRADSGESKYNSLALACLTSPTGDANTAAL